MEVLVETVLSLSFVCLSCGQLLMLYREGPEPSCQNCGRDMVAGEEALDLIKAGDPRNEDIFIDLVRDLARGLMRTADLDGAEEIFRLVLERKDAGAEDRSNLADLLRGRGQFDEARKNFERALELEPESIGALHGFGLLLIELGDQDEVARLIRERIDHEVIVDEIGMVGEEHLPLIYVLRDLMRDESVRKALATSVQAAELPDPGQNNYRSLLEALDFE